MDGQTIGRLAVMDKNSYNEYRNAQTAFFGYFDVGNSQTATNLLFDAACSWARARGLTEMRGPAELIGAVGGGVLVDGFEHRPAIGMPYNYPYYDDLLRAYGFEKVTDHLSGYLRGAHELSERFYRISEKVKARYGFEIKSFSSMGEIRAWIPRVMPVHAQAFSGSQSFYPPSEAEARIVVDSLLSVAIPGLVKLVLKDDEIVGFILCYPDVSAGLQRARGRLWPLGWYHILREKRITEWVNVNGLGVLPAYQGRGASIMLYTELAHSVKAHGFRHVDVVQVDEANLKSFNDMQAIGVHWYKRHRTYRKSL
jgi:ribosomal protein S18 acetylase RimI-like enzyme